MSIISLNRPENSSQPLAEYFLANPAPGTFFKRHLPNHRLLLQLQKVTAGTDDNRGRAIPAYDVRCGGSFVRRLAGCFRNTSTRNILIVAAGNEEGEDEDRSLVQECSVLASIRRVSTKEAETDEKLVVKFFDGVTWNCERLPSGGYQFTPLNGQDVNIQAAWELESAGSKDHGFVFTITAGSPSKTSQSPTPRSPTPKSPGTPRKGPRDVLARMDAERIQVFGVQSASKGSFLGKIDERNLERMVLVSGICVRAFQGVL